MPRVMLLPVECGFCGHVGRVKAAAINGRNAVTLRCSVCGSGRRYRYGAPVTARRKRRSVRGRVSLTSQPKSPAVTADFDDPVDDLF